MVKQAKPDPYLPLLQLLLGVMLICNLSGYHYFLLKGLLEVHVEVGNTSSWKDVELLLTPVSSWPNGVPSFFLQILLLLDFFSWGKLNQWEAADIKGKLFCNRLY